MATFTAAGVLLDLHTNTPAIGGNDIITTGDGADLVMGGSGDDIVLASANDAAAAAFLDLLAVPNYVVTQALVNALLTCPPATRGRRVLGDNGVALYVNGRLTHLDSTDGDLRRPRRHRDRQRPRHRDRRARQRPVLAGGTDDAQDRVLGDNGRMTFDGTETFDAARRRR